MLAEHIWKRAVVSQEWLEENLRMQSAANVSQQMKRLDRKRALDKVSEAMRHFLEESNDSPHEISAIVKQLHTDSSCTLTPFSADPIFCCAHLLTPFPPP